jgi:hypothetical protein
MTAEKWMNWRQASPIASGRHVAISKRQNANPRDIQIGGNDGALDEFAFEGRQHGRNALGDDLGHHILRSYLHDARGTGLGSRQDGAEIKIAADIS